MLTEPVIYVGILVGTVLLSYFVLGFVAYVFYRPKTADERAEDVTFAIPTIGSEAVRDSLRTCLEHHKNLFEEYEIYVLTDEGADLEDELVGYEGVKTLVVPDDYDCDAVAKGRAIQYFIETVVSENPEGWYSFIDDDNLVLDDQFLYEIPFYEARGYGAMNSVLTPRKGDSSLTFVMDHIRLLDDLTVFRAFTGLFKRPYIGFHGELLTAKGDVLVEVGFDRESIVEDYAFAAELIKHGIPTWQSGTHVSILSPHSVRDLLKQRSRWFIGTWNLLRTTSPVTKLVTGVRLLSWTVALLAGPIAFAVGQASGELGIPLVFRVAPFVAGIVYGGTYAYGALRLSGWNRLPMVISIPLCVVFESLSPVYAVLFADRDFTVISK
jgi:egghead protein (zeste-white 4 protein)